MKKIKKILFVLLFMFFIPFTVFAKENEIKLYFFHQNGCPHCEKESEFLESIKDEYPYLTIVDYEVSENPINYNLFARLMEETNINKTSVPFTIIGTDYYIGYDSKTSASDEIKKSIEKFYESDDYIDVVSMVKNKEDISNIEFNKEVGSEKVIPLLGKINAKNVSLPLVSIVLGLVDGFNPCAMWVLLFLISMLFNMKDKKKMWILGITFLSTSALVYLLIMASWLNVAISFTTATWVRILIAIVALVGGVINLNSYIKSIKSKTDGCTVVEDKKRKKIFKKIKDIVHEKKFILSMIGIITLAISVNLIELACSAGLPLIFTQILALNSLSKLEYALYMMLYILFFLFDDIFIFVVSMNTLSLKGISSKYGKYSHLIGGIIMVIIGILMIFKPEWLMFNF